MRWVVGVMVVGAGFAALHRIVRGAWPGRRPRWLADLGWLWFTPTLAKPAVKVVVGVPVLVLAAILGVSRDAIGQGWGPIGALPAPAQLALMLLVSDFAGYWTHRAFHAVPWLWRFHAVHHSSPHLDWLAAARVHPVNEVLSRLPVALAVVGLGFRLDLFALVAPFLTLVALLIHADVPWSFGRLGRWVASPRFHREHHAHGVFANFGGLTPLWDRLFGTASFPEAEPARFGVDEPVPGDLLRALAWPFGRERP